MRMVLVEVLWLAGISIAVALPASLLLTRAARSQLFGISSSDPITLVVVTVLVASSCALVGTAAGTPRGEDQSRDCAALRIEINIYEMRVK